MCSGQRYHERPARLGQARLDDPAQAHAGAAQSRADRRHRHAEAGGDLLVRQPVDVPQDERLAQAGTHVGQRRQHVAVGEHVQVGRLPRRLGRQSGDRRLEADLADGNLVAVAIGEEILHDSREPGARVRSRPEPMTGAQRALEGVLNQVFCPRLVAEQHLRVSE
ncbi:MAG TPA: hypothetical protein VHO67_20875 [Polyangia bacterium]|nr:hypothetical protein [Polyangia bacterium]